jgi:pimeloyl-ACP methyl ester carboxylesterase
MSGMVTDDTLETFAAMGPPALPDGGAFVERNGERIWYASWGDGMPVLLLHGGMGNANNFAFQVPDLLAAGYRAVVIDSRGHGRSSWNGAAFSYKGMADDAFAVLDQLGIARVAVIGWSDGACTGLAMAKDAPERIAGVLFFGCNVDPGGALPFAMSGTIGNCLIRHKKDYEELSPHPERFEAMNAALQEMQGSQPDYSAQDLREIEVPVTVVQAESDEFIRTDHARYIAEQIPGATYVELEGVSHFAPVQRPWVFNAAVLDFLTRTARG